MPKIKFYQFLAIIFLICNLSVAIAVARNSFADKALGSSCNNMTSLIWGLPCNPALVTLLESKKVEAHLFLGNNIKYTQEVSDLLSGNGNSESVAKLFSKENKSSQADIFIEGSYLQSKWGFAIMPYRVFYKNYQRNSVLPKITTLMGQEQSMQIQWSSYWGNDLFWGLESRWVRRKFISADFYLTEAFVEGGSDLFRVQEQNAFYLEPALLWSPENTSYRPLATVQMLNNGWVDKKYNEFPLKPEWLVGFSFFPFYQDIQSFELGVQTHFNRQENQSENQNEWKDVYSLSAAYTLSGLQLFTSYAEQLQTVGFRASSKNISGGLTHRQETESFQKQSITFIQIGVSL